MAHDMGSVFIAYALVLAIPLPALAALAGWKKALLYLIPLWVIALALANYGAYIFMYAVLFSPYIIWLIRWVQRRI